MLALAVLSEDGSLVCSVESVNDAVSSNDSDPSYTAGESAVVVTRTYTAETPVGTVMVLLVTVSSTSEPLSM